MVDLQSIRTLALDTTPREWSVRVRRWLGGRAILEGFDRAHPCVFVLSTGRVGTQTLAELFALAPNVLSLHEPRPLVYNLSKAAHEYSHDNPLAQELLVEAFRSARVMWFDKARAIGRGYVETSPQATFLAPTILRVVPEARFIHLVRSPAEVIRSGMRRAWYLGNANDAWRLEPRGEDGAAVRWEEMDAFARIAWLWAETNRWIIEFTSGLSDHQYLRLRAEDLFAGDANAIESAFDLVASKPPAQRRVRRILRKKLNSERSGDFPELDEWSPEQRASAHAFAGAVAERLGYTI